MPLRIFPRFYFQKPKTLLCPYLGSIAYKNDFFVGAKFKNEFEYIFKQQNTCNLLNSLATSFEAIFVFFAVNLFGLVSVAF